MEGDAHMVQVSDGPPGSFAHRRWLAEYRFQRGDWTDEDEAILQGGFNRRGDIDGDALAPYAEALGGEINGTFIVTPHLTVRIDPANPTWFFVYHHSFSSLTAAQAHVRKKLKLVAPRRPSAAEHTAYALSLWGECRAVEGTEGEVYLRWRGLPSPYPPTIRFHPRLWHGPTRSAKPALVALVTDVDDRPVAIHRTYLRSSGRGKALVNQPKLSLGPIMGNAIRLAPFDPRSPLVIGEGVETCLSAMVRGGQAWSAVSAVNLASEMKLPTEARDIVLLADNDPAGEEAVIAAYRRWRGEGRRVLITRPPDGFNDFNDLLLGKATASREDRS